jgi:hypothetical protein
MVGEYQRQVCIRGQIRKQKLAGFQTSSRGADADHGHNHGESPCSNPTTRDRATVQIILCHLQG